MVAFNTSVCCLYQESASPLCLACAGRCLHVQVAPWHVTCSHACWKCAICNRDVLWPSACLPAASSGQVACRACVSCCQCSCSLYTAGTVYPPFRCLPRQCSCLIRCNQAARPAQMQAGSPYQKACVFCRVRAVALVDAGTAASRALNLCLVTPPALQGSGSRLSWRTCTSRNQDVCGLPDHPSTTSTCRALHSCQGPHWLTAQISSEMSSHCNHLPHLCLQGPRGGLRCSGQGPGVRREGCRGNPPAGRPGRRPRG